MIESTQPIFSSLQSPRFGEIRGPRDVDYRRHPERTEPEVDVARRRSRPDGPDETRLRRTRRHHEEPTYNPRRLANIAPERSEPRERVREPEVSPRRRFYANNETPPEEINPRRRFNSERIRDIVSRPDERVREIDEQRERFRDVVSHQRAVVEKVVTDLELGSVDITA